jgi:hypothetical protein
MELSSAMRLVKILFKSATFRVFLCGIEDTVNGSALGALIRSQSPQPSNNIKMERETTEILIKYVC